MITDTFDILHPDGFCTVRCRGQLVGERAIWLRDQVKPLVGRERKVTLDLTDVTFMDSLGLGVIATLYISARRGGCELDVINFSARVRDLLSVAQLLSLFEPAGQSTARMP
jgi:anti-sigma B factor antagonist